jgi:hypothetical protein
MNIHIQEDSRTLREFYPDAELRHQVHYQFAHKFLPRYVQENPHAFFSHIFRRDEPGDPLDPARYIHSRWRMFEGMAGLIQTEIDPAKNSTVFRRVSDLTMSAIEVAGRPFVIVRMPMPEVWGEAFFVGVALLSRGDPGSWPRDAQARVFTLEAGFDPSGVGKTGVLCEWKKDSGHSNFGFEVPAAQDAFLQAVTAVLEAPAGPDAAESTPAKEGEADAITINVRFGEPTTPRPQSPPETKKPWWKLW